MSPLMRERATTRHLAVMEVSLDALKAAAKAAGGTVNDAYLTVITGGLRGTTSATARPPVLACRRPGQSPDRDRHQLG